MTFQDQRDIDETIEMLRAMNPQDAMSFMAECVREFAAGWRKANPTATKEECGAEIMAGIMLLCRRASETDMLRDIEVAGHA